MKSELGRGFSGLAGVTTTLAGVMNTAPRVTTMLERVTMMVALLLAMPSAAMAQGTNNSGVYYAAADGKKGLALKTALSGIIVPTNPKSWDGLFEAFKKTDTRADGYVRDWYSNATNYRHLVNNTGSYSQEGDMYNRGQTVPLSWFNDNRLKGDVVMTIPTDGYVRNKRSNFPYAEVSNANYSSENDYSKLGSCKTNGYSGTVFEPNDEIKGDIARIYFYFVTRYAYFWNDQISGDGTSVFKTNEAALQDWYLEMMMRWSKQDPIDDVELARNAAVYEVQGNRNPFVDYPGLEDYIWGEKNKVPFSYDKYDQQSEESEKTYKVSLKADTKDDDKWKAKAGEGELKALPLEGVAEGEKVTLQYEGRKRVMSVRAAKMKEVVDLSMVDCAGNTRSSRWTANCYMVHTAGDYKLPLVYGNAIKNGEDNTTAYKPDGTTSDTYCANFVNHAGNGINAPWITKSTSGSGVDRGMGITVASAELLWQDAKGLITAVGISGDYLTLTVGKNAAEQEGNALVAAKDASGNIVWSWHIWVTKQTFADLTTVKTGSHDYSVTPVNLGWVGDATSPTGYQTYYQCGRKDAFIPSTGTEDNTNHTVYDINNEEVTGLTYSTTDATFANNIKNPTTFYQTDYRPYNVGYYNLWDAQQTSYGNNIATATVKTVYDPCPAGFCVPTGNLYYYIENVSNDSFKWDNTNKGRNLTIDSHSVFFPASGCRNNGSGSLGNVGSGGYYWSATPCVTYSGRYLVFSSSSTGWSYSSRAYGFSVRAVVEE